MALWMILLYIVAAEAVIVLMLTVPLPKFVRSQVVSLVSAILPPSVRIVPFAAFLAMVIYWKNKHRLMCTGKSCTASERDRYEISIYKAQRNVILCIAACLLYWFAYCICKYYKDIQDLEEPEKRYRNITRNSRIRKKMRRKCHKFAKFWKKMRRKCHKFLPVKFRNYLARYFYLIVLAVKFRNYLPRCFYLIVPAGKFRIWKKWSRGTRACRNLAQGCFYLIVLVVIAVTDFS